MIYRGVPRFKMRNPRRPRSLRGRWDGSVPVPDVRPNPTKLRRYELNPVRCIHPEGSPVLLSRTNAPLVREATYRKFAEQVARKFYEHTVEL